MIPQTRPEPDPNLPMTMITPQDEAEALIVNGIPVERKLLESRAIRRCELQECQAHCCSCGVYLNVDEAKRILAHQEMILPHLGPDRRDPDTWFDWTPEPDHDHPDGGMLASTNVANIRRGRTACSSGLIANADFRRRHSRPASIRGTSSRSIARCFPSCFTSTS